ncbi:MAG: tyrosine-type recombinase/integrase [Melioribacteraceae bacterium]
MSSLYKGKNSKNWHLKIVINGKRQDISTKCTNRKDAENFVKQYELKLREKVSGVIKVCPTLSQGLKHYVTVNKLGKNTIRSYKNACEHFITVNGDKRFEEYTIFDHSRFIEYLDKNNFSEATKGIMTRSLFSIFNYFVKNDYIKRNPIKAIRKTELPKPISEKDLNEILNYLHENDKEFEKIVRLALLTGFRRSTICEVLGIDMDRRLIQAKNVKAGRDFIIPIYEELERFLRNEFGIEKLFVGKITKLNISTISHKFHSANVELYNKGKISASYKFHSLRHTAATNFGNKGLDLKSIKDILDHSDLKTSEGYVQQNLDFLRERMNQKLRHN